MQLALYLKPARIDGEERVAVSKKKIVHTAKKNCETE